MRKMVAIAALMACVSTAGSAADVKWKGAAATLPGQWFAEKIVSQDVNIEGGEMQQICAFAYSPTKIDAPSYDDFWKMNPSIFQDKTKEAFDQTVDSQRSHEFAINHTDTGGTIYSVVEQGSGSDKKAKDLANRWTLAFMANREIFYNACVSSQLDEYGHGGIVTVGS